VLVYPCSFTPFTVSKPSLAISFFFFLRFGGELVGSAIFREQLGLYLRVVCIWAMSLNYSIFWRAGIRSYARMQGSMGARAQGREKVRNSKWRVASQKRN